MCDWRLVLVCHCCTFACLSACATGVGPGPVPARASAPSDASQLGLSSDPARLRDAASDGSGRVDVSDLVAAPGDAAVIDEPSDATVVAADSAGAEAFAASDDSSTANPADVDPGAEVQPALCPGTAPCLACDVPCQAPGADGKPCNDGATCTQGDRCVQGKCRALGPTWTMATLENAGSCVPLGSMAGDAGQVLAFRDCAVVVGCDEWSQQLQLLRIGGDGTVQTLWFKYNDFYLPSTGRLIAGHSSDLYLGFANSDISRVARLTQDGELLWQVHFSGFRALAHFGNGVAAADWEGTIRVLNPSGKELQTFGVDGGISALAAASDGLLAGGHAPGEKSLPRLVRLDAAGQTVWQQAYPAVQGLDLADIVTLTDGTAVVALAAETSGGLLRVDATGKPLWTLPLDFRPNGLALLSGTLVAGGAGATLRRFDLLGTTLPSLGWPPLAQLAGAAGAPADSLIFWGKEGASPVIVRADAAAFACQAGVVVCNDTNACTLDLCDPVQGCVHLPRPDGTSCAGAGPCTALDACNGGACLSAVAEACADGSPCSTETCGPGDQCTWAPLDGTACSDGQACTASALCQAGACQASAAAVWQRTFADGDEILASRAVTDGFVSFVRVQLPKTGECTWDWPAPKYWLQRGDALGWPVARFSLGYLGEGVKHVHVLEDGGALFGLDEYSWCEACQGSPGWDSSQVTIWRLGSDGKPEWTFGIEDVGSKDLVNNGTLYDLKPLADGGAAYVAQGESYGPLARVGRLSANGALLWSKSFIDTGGVPRAVAPGPGGDLFVVTAAAKTAVLRLDAAGNLLWQQVLPGSGATSYADAVSLANGDVLVQSGLSWRVQPTGTVLWQKSLPTGLEATADGGFVHAGEDLLRLAGDGTPMWQAPLQGTPYHVQPLADGGFLVSGSTQDGAWLARTDAWGYPDCAAAGKCLELEVNFCIDANSCTLDACTPGGCLHTFLPGGSACADGNPCTGDGQCVLAACVPGPPGCDDGNPCTADTCAAGKGCAHLSVADDTACDDGLACSSGDACQAGSCVGATSTAWNMAWGDDVLAIATAEPGQHVALSRTGTETELWLIGASGPASLAATVTLPAEGKFSSLTATAAGWAIAGSSKEDGFVRHFIGSTIAWTAVAPNTQLLDVVAAPAGGVVACGYGYPKQPAYGSWGWLWRLDATGQTGWTKDVAGYHCQDLLGLPEGGTLALVAKDAKRQLVRVDDAGQILWQMPVPSEYPTGYTDKVVPALAPDGGFLVAVGSQLQGWSVGSLRQFDAAGALLGSTPTSVEPVALVLRPGGAWLAGRHPKKSPGEGDAPVTTSLLRLDTAGKVLDTDDLHFADVRALVPLADGGALIGGTRDDKGWLARADGQGQVTCGAAQPKP